MKYLSLFSGIGGFELGIEQSNKDAQCIGYSEIDKYAKSVYEFHFPDHYNFGDATKIKTEDLPNFDLLIGGFPCQAFSVAGKQGGFNDARGTLFFEIARILEDKKPQYFLLENVKGLLSHDKGNTFQVIITKLINLGYNIRWDVLNSKDFEVPQNRERIYIRGSLNSIPNDISIKELPEFEGVDNIINLVKDGRQGEKILSANGINTTLTATGGNCANRTYIQVVGNVSKSGKGQCGKVYDISGISPTLTCQHDYPAKVQGENVIRNLTPIEAERLQGFPDNWTQYGVNKEEISNTQRYKCCGNAVTVSVVKYIFNTWDLEEEDE